MKETGIIMSGNHPKLILDEIETMTRRTYGLNFVNNNPDIWQTPTNIDTFWWRFYKKQSEFNITLDCPYGQVGDRLWVKEKFYFRVGSPDAVIYFDGTEKLRTGEIIENFANVDRLKWRPSIHMFKEFSRITLEITDVRVEKLQEIKLVDIEDEGIVIPSELTALLNHKGKYLAIQQLFIDFWDSLNAKRGYSWNTNPWVWVISFRRMQ